MRLLLNTWLATEPGTSVLRMSNCSHCGGPVTKCFYCHHYHCDDETCSGTPIRCARESQG